MASIIKKELYDKNAAMYILSCLMRNPLLLQNEKYAFVKTDFDLPVHQMVFYAIFNMAQNGAERITPVDIDLSIKQYDSQYAYYQGAKGYDFVLECYNMTEGADGSQFESYYNRLKKFSILRDLEGMGINTTEFYNPDDTFNIDVEEQKLNNLKLAAIPDRIRARLVEIENRHIGKDEGTSQEIGLGMRALVNSLKETPEVGLPIEGDIFNFTARGARLGKMYIYSAPSGQGKTRNMVGMACSISMPYINKSGQVVFRGTAENNDYQKVLFVATEMKADEIQTLVLSFVSGVNEKKILLGNPTPDEQDRIDKALDIIDKYGHNLIVECIPDPSITLIKARLSKYIVQDGIEYIFYDYIFNSPGLVTEFAAANLREDVVLMMLSNSLKELAMNYNIFLMSATQLNDGWAKNQVGLRDQNCIRGSKAIADKIDIGAIGVKISEDEYKRVDAIWQEIKKRHVEWSYIDRPNVVVDIYKNRRGEMNSVKIFRYFDYGTCHCVDLFATDSTYNGIDEIGTFQYEVTKYNYLDLKTRGDL